MKITDISKDSVWIPNQRCLTGYPSMKGMKAVVTGVDCDSSEIIYHCTSENGQEVPNCCLPLDIFSKFFYSTSPIDIIQRAFENMRVEF